MGSTFLVSGQVRLDTGPAVKGAKEVGSEIEKLSRTGIAGFEAAQQKVIDLTKRVAELRNEVLRTNDPAASAKLNAALKQSSRELLAASKEMRGMTLESREAAEKIQLLSGTLGVQLPAGIASVLAKLPGLQSALGAAFSVSIVGAFAVGFISLIPKIRDLSSEWGGFTKKMQEDFQKAIEENEKLLRQFSTVFQSPREIGKQRLEETNAEIGRVSALIETFEKLKDVKADEFLALREQLPAGVTEKKLREDLAALSERQTAQLQRLNAVNVEFNEKGAAAVKKHAQELTAFAERQEKVREEIEKTGGAVLAAQQYFKDLAKVEQDAQVALDAENAVRQAGLGDSIKAAKEYIEVTADRAQADIKAAKDAQDAFEKTAGSIESFIDRVFIQAKSLSDVFHQFLTQLLGAFVKFISREIAAAVLGMRQASGQGSGGGILGSILGGIFGGGFGGQASGAGSGTAASLGAAGLAGSSFGGITGLPLGSLGSIMSATGSGIPRAQGGATSGIFGAAAFGGLGGLLSLGAGTAGLGFLASALGAGSPGSGALKGALGGALVGTAVGSAFLGSLALGAFAFGPVGAAIGAIIGLLSGVFGRGRQKRQATAIQESIIDQAETATLEYKRFKADFESTLASLDLLRSLGFDQTRSLGKPGRNAFDAISLYISDRKREIDAIEHERQLRGAAIGGMPLPEFAIGGPVSGLGSGLLAVLHPGEFVMRKSAVDALGPEFFGALNRAPRFADGGPVMPASASSSGGQRVVNVTQNLYQQRGESQHAFSNRVIYALRKASLDGAL